MGCQNPYKEAEIEKKISAQSYRSQKSIGEIARKNCYFKLFGELVIRAIFQK